MSHLDLRHLNGMSELTLRNCFLWIDGVGLFPLPIQLDPISICHSSLSLELRESRGNRMVDPVGS